MVRKNRNGPPRIGQRRTGGFSKDEVQRAAAAFERDTGHPPSDIAGDEPAFVELHLILAGYLGKNDGPSVPG